MSDNTLVAMDFSGCTGRVIENPNEVLSVALEEAQAWRVSLLFSSYLEITRSLVVSWGTGITTLGIFIEAGITWGCLLNSTV